MSQRKRVTGNKIKEVDRQVKADRAQTTDTVCKSKESH